MSLKKIIEAKLPDGSSIEHEGEDFIKVYRKYKGEDVLLTLEVYVEGDIGWVFWDSKIIGNCIFELDMRWYWGAYDKIKY